MRILWKISFGPIRWLLQPLIHDEITREWHPSAVRIQALSLAGARAFIPVGLPCLHVDNALDGPEEWYGPQRHAGAQPRREMNSMPIRTLEGA